VELAAAFDAAKSGGVIVAAIAAVFTIGYVANRLGGDEDWLYERSIDMFPEDGCLRVYGIGEDGVTAFTKHAIVFIAFLAYCLHVTLARRLHALAPGLTPRSILEKLRPCR
jgi:hypothetical protein